jgi:hypothetical protein
MIYGYKSIKGLIAKVYRDLQLTEEDKWVSMIEWAGEGLALIGAHYQYTPKTVEFTIDNKRHPVPCDFYQVVQISYGGAPLQYGTGTFDNTYHCDDCVNLKTRSPFVYTVNDSYFYTNFDGTVCLSYLAIPVDDDGFPMIPDSVQYEDALFRYIVTKLYYIDFLQGKITPQMYNKLEDDWNTKCMAARGKANMPNLDQMEAIKNSWVRLIPVINEHSTFFSDLNRQETINLGKR